MLVKVKLVGKSRRIDGQLREVGKPFDVDISHIKYALNKKWAVIVKDAPKKPAPKAKAKK